MRLPLHLHKFQWEFSSFIKCLLRFNTKNKLKTNRCVLRWLRALTTLPLICCEKKNIENERPPRLHKNSTLNLPVLFCFNYNPCVHFFTTTNKKVSVCVRCALFPIALCGSDSTRRCVRFLLFSFKCLVCIISIKMLRSASYVCVCSWRFCAFVFRALPNCFLLEVKNQWPINVCDNFSGKIKCHMSMGSQWRFTFNQSECHTHFVAAEKREILSTARISLLPFVIF